LYLKKGELKFGNMYVVDARACEHAMWDGKTFHYVRYKFGGYFYDEDDHWDDGGTVKPLREYGGMNEKSI